MSNPTTGSVVDKYKTAIEAGAGAVKIADLDRSFIHSLQARAGVSPDAVADYAAQMKGTKKNAPEEFPPVRIFRVEDELYLTAGSHRWRAAKDNHKGEIDAQFFTGSYEDAVLDAITSNAKHGLRPNRKDIRRSLEMLFELAKYKKASDNQLAKLIGCSPTTVGTTRKQMGITDTGKRTGADGREQDTSKIGRKRKAADAPLSKLDSEEDDEPELCRCDNGPVVDGKRCQNCIDHDRGECVHCKAWGTRDDSGACFRCGEVTFRSEVVVDGEPAAPTSDAESRMRNWNNAAEKVARAAYELIQAMEMLDDQKEITSLDRAVRDRMRLAPEMLKKIADGMRVAKGYKACPKCAGAGTDCNFCAGRGFVNMVTFKSLGGEQMAALFDMEKRAYQLRPYQQLAVDRFFTEVAEAGAPGGIIRQPTGTGKTVAGSAVIDRWLDLGPRRRVLVLCDQRQLVQQFASELAELTGRHVAIDMADLKADGTDRLVVACRQSYLPREVDGESVSRAYKFNPDDEWLVVCDEAHKFALGLKSCGHLFEHFGANPVSKRLGLTATPERGDKVSLEQLFPVIVSDYRYYDAAGGPCAINEGWAVPFDQRFVVVEGVDFKNLREVAGDFDENELESILCEQQTLASLCEPTKSLVGPRRTIVFNATVSMAHRVASYLNAKAGYVVAVAMDGTTPDLQRKDIYARFERDDFQFLCVCGLCREGFNSPGVGAIAVFRPTKSRPLAEQMKGRGSRPLRGLVDGLETAEERLAAIASSTKPDCLIVDLVGITGLGGARTCIDIYSDGVPDEVVDRASTILERGEIHDPRMAITKAESELAAEKAERIQREQEEAERRARLEAEVRFKAQKVADGHGRHAEYPLGPDSPSEKQWGYLRWRGLPTRPNMTRAQASRIIGQDKAGMSVAEICRMNRMTLEDIRSEPATAKQLWRLRQWGIFGEFTKKQASEMIDQRMRGQGSTIQIG